MSDVRDTAAAWRVWGQHPLWTPCEITETVDLADRLRQTTEWLHAAYHLSALVREIRDGAIAALRENSELTLQEIADLANVSRGHARLASHRGEHIGSWPDGAH